jgi:hypothetical protein
LTHNLPLSEADFAHFCCSKPPDDAEPSLVLTQKLTFGPLQLEKRADVAMNPPSDNRAVFRADGLAGIDGHWDVWCFACDRLIRTLPGGESIYSPGQPTSPEAGR